MPSYVCGMCGNLIDDEPRNVDGVWLCHRCASVDESVAKIAETITDDPDVMAEPKVAPKTKPAPTKSPTKPSPSPFHPPKPAIDPGPKARK